MLPPSIPATHRPGVLDLVQHLPAVGHRAGLTTGCADAVLHPLHAGARGVGLEDNLEFAIWPQPLLKRVVALHKFKYLVPHLLTWWHPR